MEHHHAINRGTIYFNGPFSMAMLNNQMVTNKHGNFIGFSWDFMGLIGEYNSNDMFYGSCINPSFSLGVSDRCRPAPRPRPGIPEHWRPESIQLTPGLMTDFLISTVPVVFLGDLWYYYILLYISMYYYVLCIFMILIWYYYVLLCIIIPYGSINTNTVWEGTANPPNDRKLYPKHFLRRYLDP